MIRNWLLFCGLALIMISLANSGGRANTSDAGNTGAPCEDGVTCGNCHFGGPYGPVDQSFKLIDPITQQEQISYAPGKLYNVEITVEPALNASRYGFQATALDTANRNAGTWLNPANSVQISSALIFCEPGSRTYIEHVLPNFIRTFRIDWEAPSCAIGDITFYYVSNAVNNDGSTSGDVASLPKTTVIPANLPDQLSIDSSSIPSGNFIAGQSISITGGIRDSNMVTLAAPDSILVSDTLKIMLGSRMTVLNTNCF